MTLRFAWVLNLDAELELARGKPGYVPRQKLLSQLAEHGKSSRHLLGPGDVLLGETSEPVAGKLGRAWCPTPLALAQLAAHGIPAEPHPDAATLRRVNHRLFAHELGGGLPDQAYVQSREELLARIDGYQRRWLLKRPLSFAGRGQLRVLGPLSDKQWTWIDASLARDGLLLEPFVLPTLELSLHGFIWRDGNYRLGRPCTQLVSDRGVFRGVRLCEPQELSAAETAALEERAAATAQALFQAGYFGPFGIDGYRYLVDDKPGFCALSEINARYTLGFVTGFPQHPSQLSLA